MFWRLICILLASALSWGQAATNAGTYRIAGTVVNALTGQPLPHAQLSINRAQTASVPQIVNADDNGHFIFSSLAPGKYVLVAQSPGFPRQAWDAHVNFSTAAVVGPGKDSEHVLFRLRPESSISGVLTDEGNEPVRDAQVMLFRRDVEEGTNQIQMQEQVSTDDRGHYHFAHLYPGAFFVAVSARPWYAQAPDSAGKAKEPLDVAYPVTYFPGITDESGATPIAITPGEKVTADFSLAPVPGLRLEVAGADKPGSAVQVSALQRVFGEANVSAGMQTVVLGDGRTLITGLAPGEVEVHGIAGNTKKILNVSNNASVKLPAPGPPTALQGKVVLGETKFRNTGVSLIDRSTGESIGVRVNPDGTFQFPDLPGKGGIFQVVIYNVPGAILSSVVASGAKVNGRTLEVGPGTTVNLTLLMSRGFGTIDGTALRDGKPAPGAMIVLVPNDLANNQSRIRRDQSDSDGSFTLPQIPPGRYTVLALQNGWDLEWQNPAVLRPYLKLGQPVLVGPNHRYETRINVQ